MNSIRRFVPSATCVLAILLVLVCGHSTAFARDNWISVRSKNFNLVGNASEKEIKQVATRMEQFREVFSQLFRGISLASPVPTTVIVFKSDSSFKPYKPVADGKIVDAAGYFQSGRDMNYIALTADTTAENSYRTIFHEYVHLLVSNTWGRAGVPPWFNEGLAEYYSTFQIEDARKVSLGKPIAEHLQLLRSSRPIPLKTLFSTDYYSLERNNHDVRGLFYAESWAMVHYLIQANEGKRLPHLGRFLELLMKNTPVEKAFSDAFAIDFVTLEKELKSYVQQQSYRINVATFATKLEFDAQMQSSPITEAEGLSYLGDLLYHMHRHEDAAKKLQEALTLNPDLSMANASLGMALMEKQKFADAKRHLAKAVDGDSRNFLAHYYYAFVLSREGMDQDGRINSYPEATAALMHAELNKAIALKPDFAESYHLLSFISLVNGNDLDHALKMINKAIALSPGSEEYLFVATQIYLRKEDFAAARKILEPLAASASDPRIRADAESFLKSVVTFQQRVAEYEKTRAERATLSANQGAGRSDDVADQQDPQIDTYSYLEDALRKLEPGQLRVQGVLTRIECSPKAIIFTVKSGTRTYRFSIKNFDEIEIKSFTADVGGELTCGVRKKEDSVVLAYKPARDARAKTDGIAISLEFVPKDFKLKTTKPRT